MRRSRQYDVMCSVNWELPMKFIIDEDFIKDAISGLLYPTVCYIQT